MLEARTFPDDHGEHQQSEGVPGYRRDLNNLLKPRFSERPADRIDEREWQDFFDELARDGLSHSRLANVKAVTSSIYACALHRTRRHVASNPLRYIELPPNLGKRRERVALAEEAERLLALLERAGHVSRHANWRDRRSVVVRLTQAMAEWAAEAWAPYVAEIDALAAELSDADRDVVRRFLEGAADAAERHADRLVRDADATAQDALAVPLPALWA